MFSRKRKRAEGTAERDGSSRAINESEIPLRSTGNAEMCDHKNLSRLFVAVHGLGGDWEDTWTDGSSGKLWLRDFLPKQYPNARVMSFGYDASHALSTSVADINDAAISLIDSLNGERQEPSSRRRPIVFVAHSLGGIVVKKALILANERSDHWKNIKESAACAIFFAVPHRGADTAYWANLATSALTFASLGARGNSNFVAALQRNSPELSSISQAFVQPAANLSIIRTFYETVKIGNQLIVDRDSASFRINNEVAVPIQGADHRNICKFGSSDSQKYRPVYNALQLIVDMLKTPINSLILKEVQLQSQDARPQWQEKVIGNHDTDQDIDWVLQMSGARSWAVGAPQKQFLYIEYHHSLEWEFSLARAFQKKMEIGSSGGDMVFFLSRETFKDGDLHRHLAQSLLSQILVVRPELIARLDYLQEEIQGNPVDEWQEKQWSYDRRIISWKGSIYSPRAPWQYL
ncbi:uncharacterized protein LY89DRAFT_783508 [Mollisia scopiformis]|uniref:DUF676 domain-containing protein n=1 Tax=Mollisia scopiformis TaxID=149040 RepID=A0A194X5J0_MOLSC|nr:uncharacterized protein LY89DRAFT_783508 [Mollisia scopiformis]KUJ15344.1 hypothetical protein LY89DRAFT_783508 [Mollisia scopiformis]